MIATESTPGVVQPAGDTPPVVIGAPVLTRYEYRRGYHTGVVELMADGLWQVNVVSALTSQLETLIYDDETLAQEGAQTYLNGLYNAEMGLRQTFYTAYLKAFGRGAAPTAHGPDYVAPVPPEDPPA